MRQIKFRAWDSMEKVMLTVCEASSFDGCDSSDGKKNRTDKHSRMTWTGACYENGKHQDYVLLQFTGLHDKYGKEIYEGDICRNLDQKHIVEYSEGRYILSNKYADTCGELFYFHKEAYGTLEVIGNIYETPGLLEDK